MPILMLSAVFTLRYNLSKAQWLALGSWIELPVNQGPDFHVCVGAMGPSHSNVSRSSNIIITIAITIISIITIPPPSSPTPLPPPSSEVAATAGDILM